MLTSEKLYQKLSKWYKFFFNTESILTLIISILLFITYSIIGRWYDSKLNILLGLLSVGIMASFMVKGAPDIEKGIFISIKFFKAHVIGFVGVLIHLQLTSPPPDLWGLIGFGIFIFILGFIPSLIICLIGVIIGSLLDKLKNFILK